MKRRGMLLKSLIAAFIVLAVSMTCMAQTKTRPQPEDQPKEQSKEQPGEQSKDRRQWKMYMEGETRRYYFDPASVQKLDKRIVKVWERITQPDDDGAEIEKLESLIELDCGSSKYRIVASREYDAAKPAQKPELRTENGPWTYFSLDTILGILYDNVCYPSTTPPGAAPSPPPEKPKAPPTFKR